MTNWNDDTKLLLKILFKILFTDVNEVIDGSERRKAVGEV